MISLTAISLALFLGWSLQKAWKLASAALSAKPVDVRQAGAR